MVWAALSHTICDNTLGNHSWGRTMGIPSQSPRRDVASQGARTRRVPSRLQSPRRSESNAGNGTDAVFRAVAALAFRQCKTRALQRIAQGIGLLGRSVSVSILEFCGVAVKRKWVGTEDSQLTHRISNARTSIQRQQVMSGRVTTIRAAPNVT